MTNGNQCIPKIDRHLNIKRRNSWNYSSYIYMIIFNFFFFPTLINCNVINLDKREICIHKYYIDDHSQNREILTGSKSFLPPLYPKLKPSTGLVPTRPT